MELSIDRSLIVGRADICDLYFDDGRMSRQHFGPGMGWFFHVCDGSEYDQRDHGQRSEDNRQKKTGSLVIASAPERRGDGDQLVGGSAGEAHMRYEREICPNCLTQSTGRASVPSADTEKVMKQGAPGPFRRERFSTGRYIVGRVLGEGGLWHYLQSVRCGGRGGSAPSRSTPPPPTASDRRTGSP